MRIGSRSLWSKARHLTITTCAKPQLSSSLGRRAFRSTSQRRSDLGDDTIALLEKTRNIGIIAHIDAVGIRTLTYKITVDSSTTRVKPQQQSVCSTTAVILAELEVYTLYHTSKCFTGEKSCCQFHNIKASSLFNVHYP